MRRIVFLMILIGPIFTLQAQVPKVVSGKIVRIENFPSKYFEPRNVDVWLPANYPAAGKYAVLYMHDGQMLFDSTITWNHQEWEADETVSRLIRLGKIKNCIVVGIWNNGTSRFADYFPQKPFNNLPLPARDTLFKNGNSSLIQGKIRSDDYLKFLVYEIKPYIDSIYQTDPSQKATFVAGSSMGGLISIYAICEYPDIFGGAACISTHWPGSAILNNSPVFIEFERYLRGNLPSPKNHKIYFDFGTETLDSVYEPYQNKVDLIMKQKMFDKSSWRTQKFKDTNHSELAWAKRLNIPLEFLLGKW